MQLEYKVGADYRVWWWTGRKCGNWNLARIREIKPYTGKYPEFSTHVLVLDAPQIDKGFTSMAVNIHDDRAQYTECGRGFG